MANTQYKAEGSQQRKNVYNLVVIVAAVVLAALITLGIVNQNQVQEFVDLAVYLIGALGGIGALVSAALARKNVEPPAHDPVD